MGKKKKKKRERAYSSLIFFSSNTKIVFSFPDIFLQTSAKACMLVGLKSGWFLQSLREHWRKGISYCYLDTYISKKGNFSTIEKSTGMRHEMNVLKW